MLVPFALSLILFEPVIDAGETAPVAVAGGEQAGACQWPNVVAFPTNRGTGICTGTLVHPELIVTAAHCLNGGAPGEIWLGESAFGPVATAAVAECAAHPEYEYPNVGANDVGFCRLATQVNVPIVPIAMGCDTPLLDAGTTASLVGFGRTTSTQSGTKHQVVTKIASGVLQDRTISVGEPGRSGCQGDSGGPAFLQRSDGSWRMFGVVSGGSGECGERAGLFSALHLFVPWIEMSSGIDVTPCHDADGAWNAETCGGFATDPFAAGRSWADGCAQPESPDAGPCGGVPDDAPPTVKITSPSSGTETEGAPASFDIEIEATDRDGGIRGVWLRIDGKDVTKGDGTPILDSAPPYRFDGVTFPSGGYVLTAVAEDWAGHTAESTGVALGVGHDAPDPTGHESGSEGDPDTESSGASAEGATGSGCRVGEAATAPFPLGLLLLWVARRPRSAAHRR